MTAVLCRSCHWPGKVDLARKKEKWSKLHRWTGIRFLLAKPADDKGKPATGVPCPGCKKHTLRRRSKVMKLYWQRQRREGVTV